MNSSLSCDQFYGTFTPGCAGGTGYTTGHTGGITGCPGGITCSLASVGCTRGLTAGGCGGWGGTGGLPLTILFCHYNYYGNKPNLNFCLHLWCIMQS